MAYNPHKTFDQDGELFIALKEKKLNAKKLTSDQSFPP